MSDAVAETIDVSRMHPIVHISGCRQVAFYWEGRPRPGDLFSIDRCAMPDGRRPEPGSAVRCFNCGDPLTGSDLRG